MNVCAKLHVILSNSRGDILLKHQPHISGLTHRVVGLVRSLLSEVLEDQPVKVLPLQFSSCS